MNNANGSLKAEVIKAVTENPDLTYEEIAELYDMEPHQVGLWARGEGIYRRQRSKARPEESGLDEQIRQAEQHLAQLRQQSADGNQVRARGQQNRGVRVGSAATRC